MNREPITLRNLLMRARLSRRNYRKSVLQRYLNRFSQATSQLSVGIGIRSQKSFTKVEIILICLEKLQTFKLR